MSEKAKLTDIQRTRTDCLLWVGSTHSKFREAAIQPKFLINGWYVAHMEEGRCYERDNIPTAMRSESTPLRLARRTARSP
jgi:hypothetical protein